MCYLPTAYNKLFVVTPYKSKIRQGPYIYYVEKIWQILRYNLFIPRQDEKGVARTSFLLDFFVATAES